jgi:tryptophan-rich sensory protein
MSSVNATILAFIVCIAAAALEGALAGRGVRQRLAALRMPPYSPPFVVWLLIGVAYYTICFIVLRRLLVTSSGTLTSLLSLVLLANAFWSVLFFRWRNLRASFLAFVPYTFVVAALVVLLVRSYPFGAALFSGYALYLLYAAWWAYRLWQLNGKATSQPVERPPLRS